MSNNQSIIEAFEKGQRASHKGKPVSACPYQPNTDRYDAYVAGWRYEEGPKYTVRQPDKPT